MMTSKEHNMNKQGTASNKKNVTIPQNLKN